MKSVFFRSAVVFCLLLLILSPASAETHRPDRIILYSYYRQLGWGDRIQVGCVDYQGQLFTLESYDSVLHWPYKTNEQLDYLATCNDLVWSGTIDHGDLTAIKSLIDGTEDQGTKAWSAACDAGTEYTYAVTYQDSAEPFCILLGMSGDSAFENTDPDAQTLYWCARQLFPHIWCYAYSDSGMGPQGFTPVPLTAFLGIPDTVLHDAPLICWENDCEEGILPVDMTKTEVSLLRAKLEHSKVVRKINGSAVSGGFLSCCLTDSAGTSLFTIHLYEDMVLSEDGMYLLSEEP